MHWSQFSVLPFSIRICDHHGNTTPTQESFKRENLLLFFSETETWLSWKTFKQRLFVFGIITNKRLRNTHMWLRISWLIIMMHVKSEVCRNERSFTLYQLKFIAKLRNFWARETQTKTKKIEKKCKIAKVRPQKCVGGYRRKKKPFKVIIYPAKSFNWERKSTWNIVPFKKK